MSSGPLDGKVALVTGASQGIGREIARRLSADGATVAVNYRDPRHGPEATLDGITSDGGMAFGVMADVSRKREVDAMVESVVSQAGRLDILINNAGICPLAPFFDVTEAVFDDTLAVNLKGTWLCSHAAARQMVSQKAGGRIIAVSSVNAIVGGSMQSHYGPTKAGQRALMNHLAVVLGPAGITCNSILPGSIVTPLNEELFLNREFSDQYLSRIPVGRMGQPEDVAAVAAFLSRDDAAYVNGAEIVVDGGAIVNFA